MEVGKTGEKCPPLGGILGGIYIGVTTLGIVGSEKGIELAVMIAQGGSPLATAIHRTLLHIIFRGVGQLVEQETFRLPMYQITGTHDRRSWHQMHRSSD